MTDAAGPRLTTCAVRTGRTSRTTGGAGVGRDARVTDPSTQRRRRDPPENQPAQDAAGATVLHEAIVGSDVGRDPGT